MSDKVMIAVKQQTKEDFRNLPWPSYITTSETRIRYIIEHFKIGDVKNDKSEQYRKNPDVDGRTNDSSEM